MNLECHIWGLLNLKPSTHNWSGYCRSMVQENVIVSMVLGREMIINYTNIPKAINRKMAYYATRTICSKTIQVGKVVEKDRKNNGKCTVPYPGVDKVKVKVNVGVKVNIRRRPARASPRSNITKARQSQCCSPIPMGRKDHGGSDAVGRP